MALIILGSVIFVWTFFGRMIIRAIHADGFLCLLRAGVRHIMSRILAMITDLYEESVLKWIALITDEKSASLFNQKITSYRGRNFKAYCVVFAKTSVFEVYNLQSMSILAQRRNSRISLFDLINDSFFLRRSTCIVGEINSTENILDNITVLDQIYRITFLSDNLDLIQVITDLLSEEQFTTSL